MKLIHAFWIALGTYSRIPTPAVEWTDENRKYSMCFFPVIGLAVGTALSLWLWLCDVLALGTLLRGAVSACLPLLVTGGIHMDGFMDTSDALASWQPPEKRLEILKDSHVGAFAVIGCCTYLLLSAGMFSEAAAAQAAGLCACFVCSRAMSALALTVFPKARKNGMLADFARAGHEKAVIAASVLWILLCLMVFCVFCGAAGLLAFAAACCVLLYYRRMALRQFGGVTGDLAGWFLQVCELASCAVLVLGGKLL